MVAFGSTWLVDEEAGAFLGDYDSLEGAQPVHVQPGMLVALGDQPAGLRSLNTGPDRFWIPQYGFEIVFVRDGGGQVSGFTLNAGRARELRYQRKP